MSAAVILPDDEDFAIDPSTRELVDSAKAELLSRPEDHNDGRLGGEFNVETEMRDKAAAKAARQAQPTREQPAADEDADLLPQLRGKSKKEIATMYVAAHRQIGINGSELGAFRRQFQSAPPAQPQPEVQAAPSSDAADQDADVAFFREPSRAVQRLLENHPVISGLKTAIQETHQRKASEVMAAEYPDLDEILADEKFREWAEASPVRMQLLRQAHEDWDVDAAKHVLDSWKAVRARSTSSGNGKTKLYRRRDIQKLAENDPARYEALADEIALAYSQGRVRD